MSLSSASPHSKSAVASPESDKPGISYYDIILFIVPLLFASMTTMSLVSPISLQTALVAGGALAAAAIAHALFVRPPTTTGTESLDP